MNRRYLYGALGLLIFVNLVVLAGVAYNRGGEPDAALTLTERELPLAGTFDHRENSGVSLALNVHYDGDAQEWFDADKLEELGFDPRSIAGDDFRQVYRVLPRDVFVVLEYDGEAWRQYRQRQLEEIAALPDRVREGKLEPDAAERQEREKRFALGIASRLFILDAGTDAAALRQRYPDRGRFLILPGRVRMHADWTREPAGAKGERRLYGRVEQILVDRWHVARDAAEKLQALPGRSRIYPGYTYYDADHPARVRYKARIAVGRRLEPWIEGIEIVGPNDSGTGGSEGV